MPTDPAHAPTPLHEVPTDNQPGHHPEVEQDKPAPARLRKAQAKAAARGPRTFAMPFESLYRWLGRPLDVRPETTSVEVTPEEVVVRFGRWSTRIDRSTIVAAEVTGPYALAKTVGPPHLSFSDRGITFATNHRKGVCLTLSTPVKGIEPLGLVRHPGVTVTVDDPEGLAQMLTT
jgi:hypothetical protein